MERANGISSYEVHRAIGITQKSAWFMDHRIRFALGLALGNKLSGQIEADETFIGAKARIMHKSKKAARVTGTGGKDKTAVMGILERGGKVRTRLSATLRKRLCLRSANTCWRVPRCSLTRFNVVVRQIVGKRLTWDQLTGKTMELETCTQQ